MTVRTQLVSLGIGAALSVGLWTAAGAQGNIVRATMTLSVSGGVCGKTLAGNDATVKDLIRAKRGDTVQWTIVNHCTADMPVVLGDWVRKGVAGADNPFDPAGKPSCTAASGKQCTIVLHVRGNAGVTTYSYSTTVNGVKKDPDLIIEG